MEATALCITLLMNVLLLFAAQVYNGCCAQTDDAAFLHIDPNRLQFFEYDSISVKCDDSTEWRVMRKLREDPANVTQWETSTGSFTIKIAFVSDSGEYWCENKEGKRSNTVNITVTAGYMILESPALPVMDGDDVTLYCRYKMTASSLPAEFYKDGLRIETLNKGPLSINSVSKSHEGLYKCSISGAGESAESWLTVRALHTEETQTSSSDPDQSCHIYLIVRTVFTIVMVALLLLLLGLLRFRKLRQEKKTDTHSHVKSNCQHQEDPLVGHIVN